MAANANTPTKRKLSEFCDPDYPTYSGQLPNKRNRPTSEESGEDASSTRLLDVITREFEREIEHQDEQLKQIDDHLAQTHVKLEKLRYSLVKDYYRKQGVALSAAEVSQISENCFPFGVESAVPQLRLHPSVKKIIGKRPQNYEDIFRPCPKRAAAQNAQQTLRVKTHAEKREARHLEKLIRERGIVIDHSKQQTEEGRVGLTKEIQERLQPSFTDSDEVFRKDEVVNTLNVPRLNNKKQHFIVIGNTSKYIGSERENVLEQKLFDRVLTHKWLVYVQSKDSKIPLESLVKKVRFYLHSSYRPNDIVEISRPPFQVSRRGWGEFPIRIQLHFHERFQQKPLQLIHHIVFDKTLSGLQTFGAETLAEIWLRSSEPTQRTITRPSPKKEAYIKQELDDSNETQGKKIRTISFTQNTEELDDSLFKFLPTIEEADIEKIQPTVLVPEPLTPRAVDVNSPKKKEKLATHLENPQEQEIAAPAVKINTHESTASSSAQAGVPNQPTTALPKIISHASPQPACSVINKCEEQRGTDNKQVEQKGDSCPIQVDENPKEVAAKTASTSAKTLVQPQSKFFQKKLVQFKDKEGKVRILQMLVATNTANKLKLTNPVAPQKTEAAADSKVTGDQVCHNTDPSPKAVKPHDNKFNIVNGGTEQLPPAFTFPLPKKVIPAVKNDATNHVMKAKNVFQKEGKLYIVDPLQTKMRQQQKSQVSLLKPQVSLLKPQAQHLLPISCHPLVSDHDYAPAPVGHIPTGGELRQSNSILAGAQKPVSIVLHAHPKERTQLEKRFARKNFTCMQAAVEYLLSLLPLIATKRNAWLRAYSFVYNTAEDFEAAPPLKQRCYEWLRGQYIWHLLSTHKQLSRLNESGVDIFWTVREIVAFARFHCYTPPIKELLPTKETTSNPQIFSDLVKCELKHGQQLPLQSLTSAQPIAQWLESMQEQQRFQHENLTENQTIDVENVETGEAEDRKASLKYRALKFQGFHARSAYLPPPKRLYHELQVIEHISKECGICLEPEEIAPGTFSPAAHILLAHILHSFVDKLIRQSIANKLHLQSEKSLPCKGAMVDLLKISPQDIGKVIVETSELDFLTNNYLGVGKTEQCEDSS